jgi:hypothetical protein
MSLIEKDIATYLDTQGVGTLGTDLFYGDLPTEKPATDSIAVILNSGGSLNEPTAEAFNRRPTFEVFISGKPNDRDDAYTFATAIELALQGVHFTVSGKQYSTQTQIGGINNLGKDPEDRPQYSLNFQFFTTETR